MFISSIIFNKPIFNNEQLIHSELQSCFNSERKKYNVLYKKEYIEFNGYLILKLLTYSEIKPSTTKHVFVEKTLEIDPLKYFKENDLLAFQVIASPTKSNDGKKHLIPTEAERLTWLERKFSENGALVLSSREKENIRTSFEHSYGKGTFSAYTYSGTLQISEPKHFCKLFETGLGREKAYGCGLIEVRRV